MPSLYAQYIWEREGKYILETDDGFATYYFVPNLSAVYIEEVFVVPNKRQSGIGREFVEQITKEAIEQNYQAVITSVDPKANGATTSLKAILATGFQIDSMDAKLIYFRKTLRGKNG